jgi:hypothetical protein
VAEFVISLRDSTASSIYDFAVATDGSGAFYTVIKAPEFAAGPTVVKIADDASIVWQVGFTSAGDSIGSPLITADSGGNLVAVAFQLFTVNEVVVILMDASDGSVVWQERLEMRTGWSAENYKTKIIIDGAGDVVLTGHNSGDTVHFVAKLSGADGTVLWAKDISLGTFAYHDVLDYLSDDDLVIGSISDDASQGVAYRLAASDGSLVWGRAITWTSGTNHSRPPLLAVDRSSDSIYAVGYYNNDSSKVELVKLDSSGDLVWQKVINDAGNNHYLNACGGAYADASGVSFGLGAGDDLGDYFRAATVFVNAAGDSINAVTWPTTGSPYNQGVESLGYAGGDAYVVFADDLGSEYFPVFGKTEGVPVEATGDTYSALAFGVTLTNGTGSVDSFTPSFGSDPTLTRTVTSLTTATPTTLTTELFPLESEGTGGGEGTRRASGFKSTAFGKPRNSYSWTVEGFRGTQFGTAELDFDLEPEAIGFGPTTRLGVPYAVDYGPPGPRAFYDSGFSGTAFGSPAASVAGQYAQLSADPSTRLGAPKARLRQAATSLGPVVNFGTVGGAARQRASGFKSTTFGTPTARSAASATGFLTTRFGTPRAPGAIYGRYYDLEGFTSTQFGTAKVRLRQAADSIVPGTQFGFIGAQRPSGFLATHFGTPTARRLASASGFVGTTFGVPRAPGALYGRYYDLEGFSTTAFGAPRARLRQPATSLGPTVNFGVIGAQNAAGFLATHFGTPSVSGTLRAQGFITGGFGVPRAPGAIYGRYYDLDGFTGTHFGSPRVRLRQAASAIAPTAAFGVVGAQHAAGFLSTIFGTPTVAGRFSAQGFISGGFGTPRAPGALYGRYYDVVGFTSTAFGSPRARLRQQAASIAPTTVFGAINAQRASGFLAANFGLPMVRYVGRAQGFISGGLGTPRAPGAQYGRYYDVDGFNGTRFGAPKTRLRQAASGIAPTVQFGAPNAQYASGFTSTHLGVPTVRSIHYAQPWISGGFGTPRAPGAIFGRYYDLEGFKGTQFGAPRARMRLAASSIAPTTVFGAINAQRATGFLATVFGAATAVQLLHPQPVAPSTRFGTPRAPGAQFGRYYDLVGFSTTHFGAPRARLRQQASAIEPTVAFGAINAQHALGFSSTAFGAATALVAAHPQSIASTRFGTPRAPGAIYGRYYDIEGFNNTAFGLPRARLRQAATTIGAVTQFGTPHEATLPHGQGFRTTQFGLARTSFIQTASGFVMGGFGTPRAPGAVLARGGLPVGFSTTQFGAPRARRSVTVDVDGFSSTAFGTPAAAQRHVARSIRPGSRFGTPYTARTCPP